MNLYCKILLYLLLAAMHIYIYYISIVLVRNTMMPVTDTEHMKIKYVDILLYATHGLTH